MNKCPALLIALFLVPICSGYIEPAMADDTSPSKNAEEILDLRSMFLTRSPRNFGIVPTQDHPRVWAVLMDMGSSEGTTTLLAVVDGTVSLYTSTGGGVIGAGEHPSIRRRAMKFISTAERYFEEFQKTSESPLPAPGRINFYLMTFSGTFTGDFDENALGEGHHKLSKLFYAGHEVISAMREKTPL